MSRSSQAGRPSLDRGFAAGVFLFALAARVALGWTRLLDPTGAITPDTSLYRRLAQELLLGRFPSTFRTPGYPAFLLLTGALPESSLVPALVCQVLLDAGTAVLLGAIAWRLTGRRSAAWLAGLFWAICPVAAALSWTIGTESLRSFLIASALFLGLGPVGGWPSALLQALCWSGAALVRPSDLLMPFIGSVLLASRADARAAHVRRQATVLALYAASVGGLIAVNVQRTGRFVLTSVPAVAAYKYELPAVQMVDASSWWEYARLWLLHPAQADDQLSEIEQQDTGKAAADDGRDDTWLGADELSRVEALRAEAETHLAGRWPTRLGIHALGALQVLRPYPPWGLGGWPATAFDLMRLVAFPLALAELWCEADLGLLLFLTLWSACALFLPGVNGCWRFRSLLEPAITIAAAVALPRLYVRLRGSDPR